MMKFDQNNYNLYLYQKILSLLNLVEDNYALKNEGKILDFGCNDGSIVEELNKNHYNVYGVDIKKPEAESDANEYIKYIGLENYHIPYPDKYFDVIYSHHVLEHIMDYTDVLPELRRILKDDGVMIHLYPTKWRVLEAHFYTPFGGVFHNKNWNLFWRTLGIVKPGKEMYSKNEYANLAKQFIKTETNYLSNSELESILFRNGFSYKSLVKEYLNSNSLFFRKTHSPSLIAKLISIFHANVILCKKYDEIERRF